MRKPMPAETAPEHVKCRWWREEWMGLSRPALAALTGYAASTIMEFERGRNSKGKALGPSDFWRYRLVCAALSARVRFDWLSTSAPGVPGVHLTRALHRVVIEVATPD